MIKHLKLAVAAATASTIALAAHAQTTLISNDPGPNRGVRAAAVNHLST